MKETKGWGFGGLGVWGSKVQRFMVESKIPSIHSIKSIHSNHSIHSNSNYSNH